MATEGKGVLKLVGGIFVVVGLALLGAASWAGNRQYTILKSWPTIEAQVTRSRVTSGRDSDGTAMYNTEIEFRYTVKGKEYITPAASPYSSSSTREMKRKVDKYAPSTFHSIRYNPADPNDIRFDVGYNFGFFFLPVLFGGMGVVFTVVSLVLLAASRTAASQTCPSCGRPAERGQQICSKCGAALPLS